MKHKLISHEGVLLTTFIFMVVLLLLAVAFVSLVVFNVRTYGGQYNEAQALYLAEAGINKAVYYLRHTAPDGTSTGSWRTNAYPSGTPNSSSSACSGSNPCKETLNLNGGAYLFNIYPTPSGQTVGGTYTIWVVTTTDGYVQVTSQGTINKTTRTVQERFSPPYLSNGVEVWWQFDENTSGNCTGISVWDASSDGNNGWCHYSSGGPPQWTSPGKIGQGAMAFNLSASSSAYIIKQSPFNMPTIQGAKTISFWENANAYGGAYGPIQTWVFLGNGSYQAIQIGLIGGYISVWQYGDTSGFITGINPPENQWYHIVYTFDGTTHSLYLNGVLQGTSTHTSQTGTIYNIFVSTYDGLYQPMIGIMDDFRVYNRALSTTEVQELYHYQTPILTYVPGSWKECSLTSC